MMAEHVNMTDALSLMLPYTVVSVTAQKYPSRSLLKALWPHKLFVWQSIETTVTG
jgi:hypothetical protein